MEYLEIIGDMFYYCIFIFLIPLGVYILANINEVEERFMNFARKSTEGRRVEYIKIFGRTVKTESPKWWNLITLKLMAITMIFMGSVVLVIGIFKVISFF